MTERDLNPLAEAALAYVRRGWSVVPMHTVVDAACSCRRADCPSVAKHPRVRWQSLTVAPASEEQVREWWRRWPSANVAVVTGAVSGVCVLDVDPRDDGETSLRRLEHQRGRLPRSPMVRTGGGGGHLWLRLAGAQVPSARLAPGLDVKGEGGLAVAPPSVHASGRRYVWLPGRSPDELDLAPVPGWLTELAVRGPGARSPGGHEHDPIRTEHEQREFVEAWARAGLDVHEGDGYYLCPFHPDHHPSLHVDRDGCRWYCFGCGEGGGIGRLRQLLGETGRPLTRRRLQGRLGPGREVTLAADLELEVVGEAAHQDDLLRLTGGERRYGGVELETTAELRPEPNNPYDPGAIEVRIQGKTVGHLRRADAARLHAVVDDAIELLGAATCQAVIRGGWDRGRDDVGYFGVVVRVPAGDE